jgi:3-methyl-2-oxobutanoate hydroxymethyltransferase
VLVFHDLLGINSGHLAKFVKRYENVHDRMVDGLRSYAREVRSGEFPGPDHVYAIEPAELADFQRYLEQESLSSSSSWDWEPLP